MTQGGKIRKILFNEITALVAIISVVIGIMNWVNNPVNEIKTDIALIQKDINIINTNHLTHIQTSLEKKETADKERDQEIANMNLKLEKILTLLDKK